MKVSTGAYIIILLTLLTTGCRKSDDKERLNWSTEAPLNIPYRIRLQRFEKGNLIRNHSFENGRTFKLDSATTSFSIDGWQQVGQHVEWTDTRADSVFAKDEAFSGYRAVKISRSGAKETDTQGEGILSDYIKVIPGNYSLWLYMKLENVMPLRARLGTRMFDGVDISVRFYDRNKNLMKSSYNYPMADQVINTSFKGLSFANYKSVSWFNWNKVTGKSNYFPFPEGDIPSEAHFVRIFIGLKGTGTMWIDSVNFSYSGKNFSVAERMLRYTDTAFHTPEVFVPSPRQIIRLESVIFGGPGVPTNEYPVITTGNEVESLVAAGIIRDAFNTAIKGYPSGSSAAAISVSNDKDRKKKARIVISIGDTEEYRKYMGQLPENEIHGHPDGYFIYSPPADPIIVILGASNGKGLINAAYTVAQMIDSKVPVFHNNRIIDYPAFSERFVAIDRQLITRNNDITSLLKEYKINGGILTGDSAVKENKVVNDRGFRLTPVPGYIMPDHASLSYRYPLERNAVLLDSKGRLTIPPVFHNEMLDNSDYSEICCQVAVNSKVIYSGCSFFSLNTDAADILRFRSVMGPGPVFMDNSMLIDTEWGQYGGNRFYPGKLRQFNLFEPFNHTDIQEFFKYLDTSMFVVNLPPVSEINLIRLATAADFLWNPESYNPEYALWKVLMSRYGQLNARELISYADKYAIILEALSRASMNTQVQKNLRIAHQTLVNLTGILSGLGERLGTQNRLVRELQQINSGVRSRLNTIQPLAKN